MKDWIGNKRSTFAQLAASNHSEKERENNDYYATEPKALEIFLDKLEQDGVKLHNTIWENACGGGHLAEILKKRGYIVFASDIIDRGYSDTVLIDFLKYNETDKPVDILTNPPYKYGLEFVEKSLETIQDGYYAIFFLKIQFLEGKARKKMFEKYPPKYVYVNSERQLCSQNGDFQKYTARAVCYCWYIWEKGWKGETVVRWI